MASAAHSGYTRNGLGKRQQGGVLSGKPWEDHTSSFTSQSSNANRRKLSHPGCANSLAQCCQEKIPSPLSTPPTSQVTRRPLLSPSHAHSCPRDRPAPVPPKPSATSSEQRTWRLIIPFPGWGGSHEQNPRSRRAQGQLQKQPQVTSLQLLHTSICSGLETLVAEPQPLIQNCLSLS